MSPTDDDDDDPPRLRKPNWLKWGEMVEAEIDDAVALSCDIEPDTFRSGIKIGPHLKEFFRRSDVVENHIGAGRLPVYQRTIEGKLTNVVRLSEFYVWARSLNWPFPRKFPKPPEGSSTAAKPTTSGRWPWGKHETKLLRHLADAGEQFWAKGYDPEKAPTNKKVVEWLHGRGVSERNAKAIATILRADNIPHGPRRKRYRT